MPVVKLYVCNLELVDYIKEFSAKYLQNSTITVETQLGSPGSDYAIGSSAGHYDISIRDANLDRIYYCDFRRINGTLDEALIKFLLPSDTKFLYTGSCSASTVIKLSEYLSKNVRIISKVDEFRYVNNFDNVYVLEETDTKYSLIDSQGHVKLIDENLDSLIDAINGIGRTKITLILESSDKSLYNTPKHFRTGFDVLDSKDERVLTLDPAVTYSLLRRKGGYQLLHHADGSQIKFETLDKVVMYLREQSRKH